MPSLAEVVDLLHGWYPPETADEYDAVGLAAGRPADRVAKVMFSVDIDDTVAAEAADWGADLLVTHHPLFLRGVHGTAATTAKGRTLATLTNARCALLSAHTNADRAAGGVSEALGAALGLTGMRPLRPDPERLDKLTTFVPQTDVEAVRAAIVEAGAGRIGDYDGCTFSVPGEGQFRPLEGAHPAIGKVGRAETLVEVRIEAVLHRSLRAAVVAALFAAHPYETPAYDLVEVADSGRSSVGSGRIGDVGPITLGAFAGAVAAALPVTARGVLVGGDPDRVVRRVAVCGGAGDFLLEDALRSDADVFVTGDLRHHPAIEFLEEQGPALVDVSHWAAEWTWLPVVEARVRSALGDTVETRVSTTCTDAWTIRM